MKDTITYRPTIQPEKLSKIIKKLKYPKVNRFIDEAVQEKIRREATEPKNAKTEAMLWEIREVLDKYKGTRFLKPSPKLARDIDHKADSLLYGKSKKKVS